MLELFRSYKIKKKKRSYWLGGTYFDKGWKKVQSLCTYFCLELQSGGKFPSIIDSLLFLGSLSWQISQIIVLCMMCTTSASDQLNKCLIFSCIVHSSLKKTSLKHSICHLFSFFVVCVCLDLKWETSFAKISHIVTHLTWISHILSTYAVWTVSLKKAALQIYSDWILWAQK